MRTFDKDLYDMYENGGMKETSGKRDYTLIPWGSLNEVVDIMQYGANKYNRDNWMKVPSMEYMKAAFRHIVMHIQGEEYDKESGFTHLAHAICDVIYAHKNYFDPISQNKEEDKQMDLPFEDEKEDTSEKALALIKELQAIEKQEKTIDDLMSFLSGMDVNKMVWDEVYDRR